MKTQSSYLETYRRLVEDSRALVSAVLSGACPDWRDADEVLDEWDAFDRSGGLDGLFNEIAEAISRAGVTASPAKKIHGDMLASGLTVGPSYAAWWGKMERARDLLRTEDDKGRAHERWLLGKVGPEFYLIPVLDDIWEWVSYYGWSVSEWWSPTGPGERAGALWRLLPEAEQKLSPVANLAGLSIYFYRNFDKVADALKQLRLREVDGQTWCAVCYYLYNTPFFRVRLLEREEFERWADVFCEALAIPRFRYHPNHRQVRFLLDNGLIPELKLL